MYTGLEFSLTAIGDRVLLEMSALLGGYPVAAGAKEMAGFAATGEGSNIVKPGWVKSDTNMCLSTRFIGYVTLSLASL